MRPKMGAEVEEKKYPEDWFLPFGIPGEFVIVFWEGSLSAVVAGGFSKRKHKHLVRQCETHPCNNPPFVFLFELCLLQLFVCLQVMHGPR